MSGAHRHLWVLADGTPAHAPPGRLTRNADGDVACHLCGRWFSHLGAHLRRHGWTADRYRASVGLGRNRALCNVVLSGRIAGRQRNRWLVTPSLQQQFDAGRDLARGVVRTGPTAAETAASATAGLQATRNRAEAHRRHALSVLTALAGARSVHDLLRGCYESGASLDDLQRLTGWARARVRRELIATGVQLRPTGANTPAGKASRAVHVDAEVGRRVGTDDVVGWLRARRTAGTTTAELAVLTGRSTAWVRARLRGSTTTAAAAVRTA